MTREGLRSLAEPAPEHHAGWSYRPPPPDPRLQGGTIPFIRA